MVPRFSRDDEAALKILTDWQALGRGLVCLMFLGHFLGIPMTLQCYLGFQWPWGITWGVQWQWGFAWDSSSPEALGCGGQHAQICAWMVEEWVALISN